MSAVSYGMVVDTRTCVACAACVIACKTENDVAEGFSRDWIFTATSGSFPNLEMEIRSERCNHCEDAPCVSVCPTGASHYGPGGTVQVTESKCTGCKACIAACPYDARLIMHPKGYIDKCTFCHHRVEQGLDPACVSSCPTRCMHFGVLDNPATAVSKLLRTRDYKVLLSETGNKPNVYYLV
jgi:Fe-S-cluster-containing dehydrogenase component